MLPKMRKRPSGRRHQQDGESGKRLQAALPLRYTPYSLAVRGRGLPLLSWVVAQRRSSTRPGTAEGPSSQGSIRILLGHDAIGDVRTRVDRSEALGKARAEELTLVASYPDGDDE